MSITNVSRRTTLAMLGLAPATAVGAETFLNAPEPGHWARPNIGNDSSNETVATALRNLADNIVAGKVDVTCLDLNASLKPDEIVYHNLTVTFAHKPEA